MSQYLDAKGNPTKYLDNNGNDVVPVDTPVGPKLEDTIPFTGPEQPPVGFLGELKRTADEFIGKRLNQLSGEEPGILNPEPDKNPILNKPFIEPLPRNQRIVHPELFPNDDRSMIGKTVDSLYDTGAGMINSIFSPLGALGTVMGSDPADMSLEGTGVGLSKTKAKVGLDGKLEVTEPSRVVDKLKEPTVQTIKKSVEKFDDLQSKLDQHLSTPEEPNPTDIVKSETGALKLRGKSSKELESIRNAMLQTLSSSERLNLGSLYDGFSDSVSKSQFSKIVDDIIESGDLQKINVAKQKAVESRPASLSDAITRVGQAVNDNINARRIQDEMVSEEKAARAGKLKEIPNTVAGFSKKAEALKGEYTKVPIEPIRNAISQVDLDELMGAPAKVFTDEFQKFRAQQAIMKVFGMTGNGTPLQPNEIKLLQQTFGDEMANQLTELHGGLALVGEASPELSKISEVANLAKSIQSSTDLSAPLRQGLPLALRKEYYSSFVDMFKSAFSEEHYKGLQEYLNNEWPDRELAKKSGLSITQIGTDVGPKEEHFLSSLPEKVPVFGHVFRGSERAYVGFIDKLRADTYSSMLRDLEKAGVQTKQSIKLKNDNEILVPSKESKELARYINVATGRGSLGKAEKYGDLLNAAFYSPRFQASRLQLVTDPIRNWSKMNPIVRKEYLKSIAAVGGFVTTANALGEALGGKVTLNSTSSDFGKVRVKDKTRVDTGAGFLQYLVLASRLATNQTTSINGKTTELGEGYRAPDRGDIALRFARSKLAPVPQYGVGLMTGKNAIGQDFDPESETAKLVIPLMAQDMYDLMKEDPSLAPLMVPAILGVGVSTFQDFKAKADSKKPKLSERLDSLLSTSLGK